MKSPIIPMSPEQLPQQRLTSVPARPYRPMEQYFKVGWDEKPDGLLLPNGPRKAVYLGQLEWAWSPMHSRIDAFYLHRSRRHWILWSCSFDEDYEKWTWSAVANLPLHQATQFEAAFWLMVEFLNFDRDECEVDHFHWVAEEGLLDAAHWREVGRIVWPEEDEDEDEDA